MLCINDAVVNCLLSGYTKLVKIVKSLEKLFIISVCLLPFVIWKNTFEGPKVWVLLIGGFLLTAFWICRTLAKREALAFSKVDYFFLLWLLVLLISSVFGVHPLESVIGGSYRHQGILFFLTLWLIGKTVEILSLKQKGLLSKGLGIAILAESVVVLLQFITGNVYFGRPLGTIGEANAVAGFLAIGYVFVLENFNYLFFAFPVISILIAESRAGILALLPSLMPLVINFGRHTRNALMILTIVLSIIFLVFVSGEKGSSPFENRQVIWKLGFGQILSRPVLGFGAESGEVVYNKAFYQYGFPLSNLIVDRAHNLLLDVAMWSGGIGLLVFCLFLFERFKGIKLPARKFAFLSFLIYSMFQPLSVVHWLFLFLL
jgi:O-antigen ligase